MIPRHNKKCCGCGACAQICPKKAIHMQYNSEGFLEPVIDMDKCINCGLCDKVCQINSFPKIIHSIESKAFIGWQSNRETSSSGGLFPLLAGEIINQGGFVCGALITEGKLKHVVTNTLSDIELMRGSKYLQSETGDVYRQIDILLKNKTPVLFVGTPCQVSGLKLFLKREDDHLLTVDFVCHGVPSPELFIKYAREALETTEPVTFLTFRDKRKGWHNPSIVIQTAKKQYVQEMQQDPFGKAFLSNMILRPCCFSCPFAQYQRCGDITLADAWSIQYLDKKVDDNRGLSLILVNSNKGKKYFDTISSKLEHIQAIPQNWAIMANPGLVEPAKEHMCRTTFFDNINQYPSVLSLLNKYTNSKNYIALLNFHFENNNYGAILTAFALNLFLNEKGYFAFNIDYSPSWFLSKKQPPLFEEFRQKYLPRTYPCHNQNDLKSLNTLFDTFIVGSDQVFRHNFTTDENGTYYLKFVQDNKRKIAYSASFGVDYFEGDESDIFALNYLLHRFEKLSIREKGGINLLKELTGLDAEHVLDPVFLINKQKYIDLMEVTTPSDNIISYVLRDEVREKVNQIISSVNDIRFGLSIEKWLETFYRAKYIVTDSFHAVCFCLIFEKPFCVVTKSDSAVERIQSLFDMLDIKKEKIQMISDKLTEKEILDNLIMPQNYVSSLVPLKEKSEKWLMDAILCPIKNLENDLFLSHYKNTKNEYLKKHKQLKRFLKIFSFLAFGKWKNELKKKLRIEKKYIKFFKSI